LVYINRRRFTAVNLFLLKLAFLPFFFKKNAQRDIIRKKLVIKNENNKEQKF
jgi:hypothetical protein